MRKTQMSIVVNCASQDLLQQTLDTLDRFEAVESLYTPYAKNLVQEIHSKNKSAAFFSPFQLHENLDDKVIIIKVVSDGTPDLLDRFENVVVVSDTAPSMIEQLEAIAAKYEIDLGDFLRETETIAQPTQEDCLLCKIYKRNRIYRDQFAPHSPDDQPLYAVMNTVLYESENFYVVPAKGALVEGYVMIVPKEHVLSFAALSSDKLAEAMQVLADIQNILGKIYGPNFLVFEHGSGAEGKCKHEKAIVHAHLHVIPFTLSLGGNLLSDFHLSPLSLTDLHQYAEVPYLLYRDMQHDWHISADPEVYIPRQCIRQVLGDQLGLDGLLWNWRKHSFMDKIEATVQDYYDYLKGSYMSLDSRTTTAVGGFLQEMQVRKTEENSNNP